MVIGETRCSYQNGLGAALRFEPNSKAVVDNFGAGIAGRSDRPSILDTIVSSSHPDYLPR